MIQYFASKNREKNKMLYACLNCSNISWAETYVVKFQSPFKKENFDIYWGNLKYVQKDRSEIAKFIVYANPKMNNKSFEWEPIEEEQINQVFEDKELNMLLGFVKQYIEQHIKEQENESRQ